MNSTKGFVFQQGQYDCGQSIILSLLRKYEKKNKIMDSHFLTDKPLSMLDMKMYLEQSGFRCRGYGYDDKERIFDWLKNTFYSECVFLMKGRINYNNLLASRMINYISELYDSNTSLGHWVLYESFFSKTITLFDPFMGILELKKTTFLDNWDGKFLIINNIEERE